MGNALTGAMTDIMHDVWMCSTDDVQMGAMTDESYNVQTGGMYDVWTDGMDNAQTGAMKDVPYGVWTDGDFTMISCR